MIPDSIYLYLGDGILVDEYCNDLYIEIRTYGRNGRRHGGVWQTIPREEAVKMANAILKWAKGAEE